MATTVPEVESTANSRHILCTKYTTIDNIQYYLWHEEICELLVTSRKEHLPVSCCPITSWSLSSP